MEAGYQKLLNLLPYSKKVDTDFSSFDEEAIEGIYSCAYHYFDKKDYVRAEWIFSILTTLRLRSARFWKGLAATYQMQKLYTQAVEAYGLAAIYDEKKSDPSPHFHAAECLLTLGEVKQALKALRSAKAIARKAGHHEGLLDKIAVLQETWGKKR